MPVSYTHLDVYKRQKLFIGNRVNYLEQLKTRLSGKVAEILTANRYFLELAETKMKYADPKNILEKGFSITLSLIHI